MRRMQILVVVFTLVAAVLGLGGCRRTDTNNKQVLPLVGGENSPLPTPSVSDSPVTQ